MDKQVPKGKIQYLVESFLSSQTQGNREKIEEELRNMRMQNPVDFVNSLLQILESGKDYQKYDQRLFIIILLRQCLCGFESSFKKVTYKRFKKDDKISFYNRLYIVLLSQFHSKFRQKLSELIGEVTSWMLFDNTKIWLQVKSNIIFLLQNKEVSLHISVFVILKKIFQHCPLEHWADRIFFKQLYTQAFQKNCPQLRLAVLQSFSALASVKEKEEINELKDLGSLLLTNFRKAFDQFEELREEVITVLDQTMQNVPSLFTQKFDDLNYIIRYFFQSLDQDSLKIKQMLIEIYISYYQKEYKLFIKREEYQRAIIQMIFTYLIEAEEDINEEWLKQPEIRRKGDQYVSDYYMSISLFDRVISPVNIQQGLKIIAQEAKLLLRDKEDWRKSYVAIMSLSTLGEHLNKAHDVKSIVEMLHFFIKDNHPKIKFAVCHTIGVFSDGKNYQFYATYGNDLFIGLLSKFQEFAPRIRAQAAVSLSNLLEGMQFGQIGKYFDELMQILLSRLIKQQSTVKIYFLSAISSAIELSRKYFFPYLKKLCQILFEDILKVRQDKQYKYITLIGIQTLTIVATIAGHRVFSEYLPRLTQIMCKVQQAQLQNDDGNANIHILMSCWARLSTVFPIQIGQIAQKIVPSILKYIYLLDSQEDELKIINEMQMLSLSNNIPEKKYRKILDGPKDSDRQKTLRILHSLKEFISKLRNFYIPYEKQTKDVFTQFIDPKYPQDIRIQASKVFIEILKVMSLTKSKNQIKDLAIQFIKIFYQYFEDLAVHNPEPFLLDTVSMIIRIIPFPIYQAEEIQSFTASMRSLIYKMLEAKEKMESSDQKSEDPNEDEEQFKRRLEFKKQNMCESCIKIAQIYGGLLFQHKDEMREIYLRFISEFMLDLQFFFKKANRPFRFPLTIICDSVCRYGFQSFSSQWKRFHGYLELVCESSIDEERTSGAIMLGMLAIKTPSQYILKWGLLKKWLKILRNSILMLSPNKTKQIQIVKCSIIIPTGKILHHCCKVIEKQDFDFWLSNLMITQKNPEIKEQYSYLVEILTNRKDLLDALDPKLQMKVVNILKTYIKQVQLNLTSSSKLILRNMRMILDVIAQKPSPPRDESNQ